MGHALGPADSTQILPLLLFFPGDRMQAGGAIAKGERGELVEEVPVFAETGAQGVSQERL